MNKERFSGRDLAEALAAARQRFGVSRRQLAYEILGESKIGPVGEAGAWIEILAWVVAAELQAEQPAAAPRGFGRSRLDRSRWPGGRRPRADGAEQRPHGARRGETAVRDRRSREAAFPLELPALLPGPDVTAPEDVISCVARALIGGLDLSLRIAAVEEQPLGPRVQLEGEDGPLLLENDGEGLDALQHLANRILQQDGRVTARVSFDVSHRRANQEATLLEQARRLVEEVRATGEERRLPALGPYERRLIHMALAGAEGVKTYSTGAGRRRRLHIALASAPTPAGSDASDEL